MKQIIQIKARFLRGLFDQNTYIAINGDNAIIIDAGAEFEDVKKVVKNKNVKAILFTHLHFDHFWNIEEYLENLKCPIYICEGAEEKFFDSNKNASFIIRNPISKNINYDKINYYKDDVELDGFNLKIYRTPGHTADSVCILWENNLFSGDTIFIDNIGRTDLYDSSSEKILDGLRLIKEIDCDTVYPGHYDVATKSQIDRVIDEYL